METTITEFLQNQYKEYSLYTIEHRSIPSLVDGLKPTARKVLFVANNTWKTGNEKSLKVFQLSGAVANQAYYHHGDSSLSGVIINMAQSFKNSLPLLEEDGQFGSLRSPEPGAPRYIGTKLSKNFRLLYKDFQLLENKEEEGEVIEPKFFLPIIPTVLLNGSSGIAVGFSSNILNRNPNDLIDACAFLLKGRKIDTLKPYVKDFKGEFINDPENPKRWIIRGKFEIKNTSTIHISELPPSMTYEKYEEILEDLIEKKKIVSYDNNCKNNIDYTIKFTREDLANLDEEKLIKLLKLEESNTEIFTTLDENGKIKLFESDKEIIEYFVDFRLKFYVKRKQFMLDALKYELKMLANRGKFIRAILENKLEVKNKTKEKLISEITLLNLDLIDDSYDYLLRMPLWSLTKELFEKLKGDFVAKKDEILELEKVEPTDMYLSELKELKQKINKK